MKTKGILGLVAAIVVTANVLAMAAPVDHVYVSNNKLDMLNLDGSLNKVFLPGSTDGICRALAVDGNTGNVWLACEGAIATINRLYLFDANGNILHQCSNTPQFCAVISLGGGICIDPFGNAWITDRINNQVWKFQPDGTRNGPYSAGAPSAIACDSFGNIWTMPQSTIISKLDNSGNLIGTFGPFGNILTGIATDNDGNVYLTSGPDNLFILDNNGSQQNNFHPVLGPESVALDQNDNIWISSAFSDVVIMVSQSGSILSSSPVTNPYDLAIDASGNVWAVSSSITKISNDGTNLGTFPLSGNSGMNDTGFLHKRFVLGYNSVDGPDVWVPLNGGAPAGAVTLWFDYINTKGDSSYTESGVGTAPPGGWKLGTPPRYYDITSTVTYTGNIEVCIGYNESEFSDEAALKLFHNDGSWSDVTTLLDTVNNIVCGTVTGLSEFAPMEPAAGPGPTIPTVSDWVLILMAAMLMIVIAWRLKRQTA